MMPESEDPAGGTAGRGTAIALFFAANVLFGSGLFFHAFLYNFYIEGVGHAENVMGVAAAAISAGGLLALIPAGIVVDRFGTATAYVLSALLTAAGLTAGALVRAPFAIYLAAAAAGAGAGAWRVTMAPALLRIAPPGLRSRAFSWNTAFLVGSGAIWTAAAGAAATRLETVLDTDRAGGLRAALLLGAVATISAAALGAAILRTRRRTSAKRNEAVAGRTSRTPFAATMDGAADRVRPESEPAAEGGRQSPPAMAGASPESSPEPTERPATDSAGLIGSRLSGGLRQLSIPRRVALLILGTGVVWTAGALALPFYNIYFRRVHGLGIERIGLILGVGQVITAAAVFASGEGAARLGPRRMLTGWLLLFPPALWGLAVAGGTATATAFYLIQAFVLPAIYPLVDQIVLERVPAGRQGAVSSWRNVATEGSGLIGASAGGYLLATGNFKGLFGGAGGIALIAGIATIRLLRRHARE